jgi:hypothetical protein
MQLVEQVRAEIASLTGGMSKFHGAQARTEAFNEYIAKRGAA